ncbi:MAG TPA: toprim domain-containing protein, partial [Bradyrhizobium sp.]|nr:toprim domain-containing protein [Bradyrhizobium sp.]
SAAHLAAIRFPPGLERLYVARDDDPAGTVALARLTERADQAAIEIVPLEPKLDDFNSDLLAFWREGLASNLRLQLRAEDADRLL